MAIKNYSSFSNDYGSYSLDSGFGSYGKSMNMLDNPFVQTRYNTNPFLKGYSYNDVNVSDLMKGYENTLQQSYLLGQEPGGRSMLDRVFDGLLVGNYVSAGLAKSAIDPNLTASQAISNALQAANPFGKGLRAGEYSYSGVLEDAGWKPESTMGKIARGTVGFVGDVLLDPLTYLTGGTSALLKGTGRVGRAGEALVKMTSDDAAKIVENTSRTRNLPLDPEQLKLDSEKLASEYNRLMGVRESGNGITFGLGNLPFAEKAFGKAPTIVSDSVVRQIGDNTFAPVYAAARDAFYGSRIGEMFSPRTPLYRAAKEDPAKLYDFLKFTEMTQGLNVKKHDAERLIMNKIKLLNMSPYEEKQVLDLLQNKSIWETIRPVIKLAKTEEGASLKQALTTRQQESKARFTELSMIKSQMDSLKQSGVDHGAELDALQKQYRDTLIQFDVKSLKSTDDILAHNQLLRKELDQLNATGKIEADAINSIVQRHTIFKADKHNRNDIIDEINKTLYDGKRVVSYAIGDKTLDELVRHFKDGVNKQFIRDVVEGDPRTYSGSAKRMYEYIASKMGYKSWDESFKKPYADLADKVKKRTATKDDLSQIARLDRLRLMRESMVKEFDGANTIKDVEHIIMSKENKELFDGIDSGKYTGIDVNAERRAQFNADDAAQNKPSPFAENTFTDHTRKVQDGYITDTHQTERGNYTPRPPVEVTRQNRLSMYLDIAEHMNWSKKGIHTLNPRQKDIVIAIQGQMEALIKNPSNFYDAYHMMQPDQINKLYREALSNAIKARPDLINTVRTALHDAAVKSAEKEAKKIKMREEYAKARAAYLDKENVEKQVSDRRDELLKAIEDNALTLQSHKDTREALIADFKQRIDDMDARVKEVNKAHEELFSKFGTLDGNEIRRLEHEVSRLDKALIDDNALETYMRSTLSRKDRKALHNKYSVAQTALDANMNVDDKVREIVKILRGDFQEIAMKELEIGKLTEEQVTAMFNDYVPRLLTPEGQKFFANQRELVDKRAGLTKDLGYGVRFSPHSLHRKITSIELDGVIIKNPTIEQLNEHYFHKLNGNSAYVDSISDLYLARAMKHTELMYDNEYMREMLHTFGIAHQYGDTIKDGYKVVVNWGMLRKNLWDMAQDYRVPHGDTTVKIPADLAVEHMLKRAGLSENILADMRTPMVELSKEQADELMRISGNFRVAQVQDSIVQKANQARKLQIAKDQSDFMKVFDKITHIIKLNQTTVLPSFHARNKLANTYLNWLGVGVEALDPRLQVQAWKAVKTQGKLTDKRVILVNDGTGVQKAMDWNEIYHLSKTHGVIDEGFFAKDIGANTRTTGVLPRVRPKFDPTDSENFFLYKKGGEIGNQIENSDRLIHFAALLKQGKTVEEAANRARQFLFDYSDLTAFEQNVMKRIIPFYTWLRKNSALQVEQLIEQPEKFRFIAKSLNGIEGMSNQKDRIDPRYLNSFAQDWVQLPFLANGKPNPLTGKSKQEPVLWNPNLPFQDIGRIPDPFNAKDTLKELFTQSNPLLRVPIEEIANHNYFLDKEIVGKGDNQVTPRLDHVLSQLALYGVGKGFVTKDGLDAGLHALNTATGIKTMTYDYNSFKQDLIKKKLAEISH